jgi:glc operon protein GlcG
MALTLAQSVACIERGCAKARELGFEVAVAVVDDAGHLVACHRMDSALWITPEIARAKANAAAAFRASTGDLEGRFAGARQVPLVVDGRIVGAVGVSGAVPADNDHAIATAAAGSTDMPQSH